MKEDALGNEGGGSSSNVGSSPKEISFNKKKSLTIPSSGNSPTKDSPPTMNLSLISKSRPEKTTKMIIEERKELEESVNKDNEKKSPRLGKKTFELQPVHSIDHTLFLEARVRNLNESVDELNTQIQQEDNSMSSLKVRRRRVKNLIVSMLTRLLRYPIEALYGHLTQRVRHVDQEHRQSLRPNQREHHARYDWRRFYS